MRKSNKRISIILISIFFISLFQFLSIFFGVNSLFQNQNSNDLLINPKQSYYNNSCEPIHINNFNVSIDWAWAADQPWCTFDGETYYLENLTINAHNSSSYCIWIENSNVPFIIRNCTLYNCSDTSYYAAIKLENVNNSIIENNNASYNQRSGIYMSISNTNIIKGNLFNSNEFSDVQLATSCQFNQILNNTCDSKNAYYGIYLHECDHNTIYNNTVENQDEAIKIESNSNYNNLTNNVVKNTSKAIQAIAYCDNNTLHGNILSNASYGISISLYSTYNNITFNEIFNITDNSGIIIGYEANHTIIYNNTLFNINQNSITSSNCYYISIINNTLFNYNQRGISLTDTNSSIVQNNNLNKSFGVGIYLYRSFKNNISLNEVLNNSDTGIYLRQSKDNKLLANTISANLNVGIMLDESEQNNISTNIIKDNENYGIQLIWSKDNEIKKNIFTNNKYYGIDVVAESNFTKIIGNIFYNSNSGPTEISTYHNDIRFNAIEGELFDTIVIDNQGNGNFTWAQCEEYLAWCNGAGIASNPYIFENITINGRNASSCIEIYNSESYFIIKDCMTFNSSHENHSAGIKLVNVNNGKLIGNNCSFNNRNGFYLEACQYVDIINNTVNNNAYNGLVLQNCEYINITNNNSSFNNNSYCGIFLNQSSHNEIIGNTIKYNYIGLWLHDSFDITNQSNTISDNIINNKQTFSSQGDDPDNNGVDLLLMIILIIIFTSLTAVGIISGIVLKKRFGSKEDGGQLKLKKEPKYLNQTTSSISEEDIHKTKKKDKFLENQVIKNELTAEEKKELQQTESEVDVRRESFICVVHKGPIVGTVYICPQCQTLYCQECVRALKKNDEGCWICNRKFD